MGYFLSKCLKLTKYMVLLVEIWMDFYFVLPCKGQRFLRSSHPIPLQLTVIEQGAESDSGKRKN